MERLFKGKYIISAYDSEDDDTLVGLWDNPKRMAEDLRRNYDTVFCQLWRCLKGDTKMMRIHGVNCHIYITEAMESDECSASGLR